MNNLISATEAHKLSDASSTKIENDFIAHKVDKILNKISKKIKRRTKCGGFNLILPYRWTDKVILQKLKENGYIVESLYNELDYTTICNIRW